MALQVAHGYMKTGTGAPGTIVTITPGFTAKFLMFLCNGRTEIVDASSLRTHKRTMGFATGVGSNYSLTSRSEQNVTPANTAHDMHEIRALQLISDTADTTDGEFFVDAVGATDVDLEIAVAFDQDYTVEWYAFGGTDITNVALITTIEPAVAGVVNIDSFGFTPDVAFLLSNASGAATVGVSADSRWCFGVATTQGAAIANAVISGGSDDGANPSQAISYGNDTECIGMLGSALDAPNTRARVTAKRTLGLELTYDEVQGAGTRETVMVGIKGGQWALRNFTTSVDLTNKVLSGLGFNQSPRGGIVFSHCHPESASDIADTGDETSIGWFASTSDRAVMAIEEIDNVVSTDVQSAYEKDSVYLGCNGAGGIDARIDINAIAEDSLTFSQSLIDANGRFVQVLAFADSIKRELIGKGNVMGGVLTL
jgi:hypothetical protein